MVLGMMVTVKRGSGQCFDEIVLGLTLVLLGRAGKQQSGRYATILQLLLLLLLLWVKVPSSGTV